MACCLVVSYLFGSLWKRFRRGGRGHDQSAWLAYYYDTVIAPTQEEPAAT